MRSIIFAGALLLLGGLCLARTPADWLWLSQAGGTGNEYGYSISHDNSGNSFVTGYFSVTASFGTHPITCSGGYDIFIAKLDANGNWLWAVRAGGYGNDQGNGINTDSNGNIYVTGYFTGLADFGTTSLTSAGAQDIFIAKLDTNGNWLWAVRAGGVYMDSGNGVSTDSGGNCYVTGYFQNSATFGSISLTSDGWDDIFVTKLDTNGHWLWGKCAEVSDINSINSGCSISTDDNGNSHIIGIFYGAANFGTTTLTSVGGQEIFIVKLDSDGNWLWGTRAGGVNNDDGVYVSTDNSGNIYATGAFQGTAGFGTTTLTSNGSEDIFVAKLDTAGNWLWATRAGGEAVSSNNTDSGIGISTDTSGNSYVTGYIFAIADFSAVSLACCGYWDLFIAKLDAGGNWVWAMRAGGESNDAGWGISTDGSGNSYLIGAFSASADFGTTILTSTGERDVVVAKLSPGDTGIEDDTTPAISSFSTLYAAYPNPFRSGATTQIKTYVADHETGILSIYNLKGQCIKTYELSPGTRETDFDGSGLASGVYLYRLRTPLVNTVKKLVLLK
jgi:hypothetical protein